MNILDRNPALADAYAEEAEKAQRAFLDTASTAQLIFCARSKVQELEQRNYISGRAFDEEMIAECLRLTKGDMLKAQLLASAAIA